MILQAIYLIQLHIMIIPKLQHYLYLIVNIMDMIYNNHFLKEVN